MFYEVKNLCEALFLKVDADEISKKLCEGFIPDEVFLFGSQLMLDMDHIQRAAHAMGSQSFDGVCSHCPNILAYSCFTCLNR